MSAVGDIVFPFPISLADELAFAPSITNNSCNPGMFWTKGTQAQKYRAQDECSPSLLTCLIVCALLFVKLHLEEKLKKANNSVII
jgi:hypothetical protein